jgi:chromosome partitioning protein
LFKSEGVRRIRLSYSAIQNTLSMPVISIASQKRGVGKTTTTINLGATLQLSGKKVLLIDEDPLAGLSQSLGIKNQPGLNLDTEIKKEISGEVPNIKKAIVRLKEGLHIIPSSKELADTEMRMVNVHNRERVLTHILEPVIHDYDFIFIDCPHSIGMLTVNALVASDEVIIPLQAEFLPLKGVQSFIKQIKEIKKRFNQRIELLGILFTKFDPHKSKGYRHLVQQELETEYRNKIFQTSIGTSTSLAQAREAGIDIFSFDKSADAAKDYHRLGQELLQKFNTS